MSIAASEVSIGSGPRPDQERVVVEDALILARRRADACSPGGPSWDAAMGLVDDLERAIRQLDDPVERGQIRQWAGAVTSR
jgi:hypothetical protein